MSCLSLYLLMLMTRRVSRVCVIDSFCCQASSQAASEIVYRYLVRVKA
jgi:hypothetical protein